MFLVKLLKEPPDNFNIFNYISFSSGSTRSASSGKLVHNFTHYCSSRHFYFNRIVRLWNALPQINLNDSFFTIKRKVRSYFWHHFIANFDSNNICSYHLVSL